MKNMLLALTIFLLSGCYAGHTVKQDFQLESVTTLQAVLSALASIGYALCHEGNKNDYCFQNRSYPSFSLINTNGTFTIEMKLTHVTRKRGAEKELSEIENALLKVNGVMKLCRHNETTWGMAHGSESKCPGS